LGPRKKREVLQFFFGVTISTRIHQELRAWPATADFLLRGLYDGIHNREELAF